MAKKILFAVFGGLAFMGVILMSVGIAMGGRVVDIGLENGRMVMDTGSEEVDLGAAPYWLAGMNWRAMSRLADWHGRGEWDSATDMEYAKSGEVEVHAAGEAHQESAAEHSVEASAVAGAGAVNQAALPFAKGEVQKIDVEIDYGHVKIVEGDEFGLSVAGSQYFTSEFENGEWDIEFHSELKSIKPVTEKWDELPRFHDKNGNDVTMEFTITVPKGNYEVDASLDLGLLSVKGLDVTQLELSNSVGKMEATNCKAAEADFSTDVGYGEINGFSGKQCELKVSVGSIQFEGEASELLKLNCDVGAIKATVPAVDTYGYNAQVDLGHASIGTQQFNGNADTQKGDEDHDRPFFDIECGLGSVEVKFK